MAHLMWMWPGMCSRCPRWSCHGPSLKVIITPDASALPGLSALALLQQQQVLIAATHLWMRRRRLKKTSLSTAESLASCQLPEACRCLSFSMLVCGKHCWIPGEPCADKAPVVLQGQWTAHRVWRAVSETWMCRWCASGFLGSC